MFTQSDEQLIEAFKCLNSRKDIADILEISDKSLRYFLYAVRPENMYNTFVIKKKNGGVREICAPNSKLKNIQRKLTYILELIYVPKICAYGFIKNKNIVNNAKKHIKKRNLLNIDLKDFFHQIHFGRIQGMLKAAPYFIGNEAAITIAQIACFNGYLPQGAPSSPILTNMICAPLDNQLMKFAKKNSIAYSRYVDDLSFSTYKKDFPKSVVSINEGQVVLGLEFISIINKNGFNINEKKINYRTKRQRQEVTGLVVNKFPNLKREYVKNLRAILYKCRTNGIYSAAKEYINKGFCHNSSILIAVGDPQKDQLIINWFTKVIIGKINYIGQVKGKDSITFLSFAQKANEIFGQTFFDTSLLDELNIMIDENVLIIESEYINQGSGFYVKSLKGVVTCAHVIKGEDFYTVLTVSGQRMGIVSNTFEERILNQDYDIDYKLLDIEIDSATELIIGDSKNLKIGDDITIAGFPNYKEGDSVTKQSCEIVGLTKYHGAQFYKISGRIVHGASGGVVFNTKKEVIGLIKGGVDSLDKDATDDMQGFVPMHLIIEDIHKKE